eukprot:6181574-Pleurochrysis_carterae.AAC.1
MGACEDEAMGAGCSAARRNGLEGSVAALFRRDLMLAPGTKSLSRRGSLLCNARIVHRRAFVGAVASLAHSARADCAYAVVSAACRVCARVAGLRRVSRRQADAASPHALGGGQRVGGGGDARGHAAVRAAAASQLCRRRRRDDAALARGGGAGAAVARVPWRERRLAR